MRLDDAVETFKSHKEYEEGTAILTNNQHCHRDIAMPLLIRCHVNSMDFIQVPVKICNKMENVCKNIPVQAQENQQPMTP